jgi:hypothetical protein
MRTKALLSMAALAASTVGLMAASPVYSLNVVGYANVPTPLGYSFQANPFDIDDGAGHTNLASTVIANPDPTQDYSGPWDASQLQTWSGVGFTIYLFDSVTSDTTTGFTTTLGAPVASPTLGSGVGYLINNGQAASNNITYVGNVRIGTNNVNFPIAAHAFAIGSPLPLGGGVSSSLGMVNADPSQTAGPLDGGFLEFLKVNSSGQATGYRIVLFDSLTADTSTGFTDTLGNPVPEPQVGVGGGYFLNTSGLSAPYTWTQIYTNGP